MTPDWNDAPSWAQWVAMDGDGCWYWFERQPRLNVDKCWRELSGGKVRCIAVPEPICHPRPATESGQ